MEPQKSIIIALMKLDPRGGYFKNELITDAISDKLSMRVDEVLEWGARDRTHEARWRRPRESDLADGPPAGRFVLQHTQTTALYLNHHPDIIRIANRHQDAPPATKSQPSR